MTFVGSVLALCASWLLYRAWPGHEPTNGAENSAVAAAARFTDITHSSGVQFTYFRGETDQFWLTETTGGGVGLVDYDGDGWLDIYFVNGCRQPYDPADLSHTCELFRNQHDGTFVKVSSVTGVAHHGYGQGCGVGDYDNDGFDDLYVTCYGSNVLYHNNGDGTFREVTCEVGCECSLWSTGCAFADLDRDGNLDLFVVNYVDFDPKNAPICGDPRGSQRSYCGPNSFGPLPARLFANNGDGTFTEVSEPAGINLPGGQARPESKGLGVQVADFDGDGWLDLFVANDQTPSFLFHNLGGLRFREVGMTEGVALTGEGATTSTMGIACGDYDGDGRLDLLTTNFYLEAARLFHNVGGAGFRDETAAVGLASSTRGVLGWGTALFDFDNDGWLDLFMTNGHIHHDPAGSVPYAMPALLFRNSRRASFQDVGLAAGPYFRELWNGRGAAFGDLDNDGDTDIVVVHHHQPAAILRNDTPDAGHYLSLHLVGRQSDRNAIGAQVVVLLDDPDASDAAVPRRLVRQVNMSGSYLSTSDPRVLVGLGRSERIRQLEIRWSSGQVERWNDLAADQSLRIRQGLEPRRVFHGKSRQE